MNPIKIYAPFSTSTMDLAETNTPIELVLKKSSFFEFISEPSPCFYFTLMPMRDGMGEYKITENIISELKNKKTILIITDSVEANGVIPISESKIIRPWKFINPIAYIKKLIQLANIDLNQIIYIDSNIKMPKSFAVKGIHGIFFSMWESYLELIDIDEVTKSIQDRLPRQKKFLFFGGKSRQFRLEFLKKVTKIENFEKDSFISIQAGDFYNNQSKKVEICIPEKNLDCELSAGISVMSYKIQLRKEYHLQSYINIVPLTFFSYNHHVFGINEKLFKPIVTMQPFLILGQPHTLHILRQMGYQTFSKWFNESYDNIIDDELRMNVLIEEINRLNNLSIPELSYMLLDMLPVLTHNATLFQTRKNSDFYCKNLAVELVAAAAKLNVTH